MDANGHKYVENDLCFKVTGCAMEVLNGIGHGLREKTYERGLCVEFEEQGNYLKITGMSAGLILNFKHAKLQWKKVVLTESR